MSKQSNSIYSQESHGYTATETKDITSEATTDIAGGLRFRRVFTRLGIHPFDEIDWEKREAQISGVDGEVLFNQKNVEVPKFWSQSALNIAASKYLQGKKNTPQRESSMKQLIGRVAKTIADYGREQGYFATPGDADTFETELIHILITQKAAFNTPVWLNVGIYKQPQCSACFINSVEDDMKSILNLAVTEGMLFKYGSGTGTNLSPLRSSREFLSNSEGKASGPVSFMRGFDAFAGVIKSGGKMRRAAKMVILNVDHPDILEFIRCKAHEEKKAWDLIEAGYDGSFTGEAYRSVFFQNSNNSVRVTDEFMKTVENDDTWETKAITTGKTVDKYQARKLFREIAEATHICGDPGLQFDTVINKWHTAKAFGRINSSNPCSEYMFLDDSACNLASINLMKYRLKDGSFNVEDFKHTVDIMLTAQEILVDLSGYPTQRIAQNSHDFRPLGLGYANLGALLMSKGLPYDSDKGRHYASAITSLMTGQAYRQSAIIAKEVGPFKYWDKNKESFLEVLRMHKQATLETGEFGVEPNLLEASHKVWDEANKLATKYGERNAQVTVLAPTGTIGFLMDCDTTGIEPDIALVKYKWLSEGGMMKIVNRTVDLALKTLGYSQEQVDKIMAYIEANDTIEDAPELKEEHLAVFDCAFKPKNGKRSIHHLGHIRMMVAAQPFLSGAISKTVNMPHGSTVKDIEDAYMYAWKQGLKSIAIYRDGSKRTQPLTTGKSKGATYSKEKVAKAIVESRPVRRRLPDERNAVTHKFSIAGHKGYLTVGLYEDGTPGEIFVSMSKTGSVISGLMDSFAISISIALQYGVPIKDLVRKFAFSRFEPSGYTSNPQIQMARSIVDYMFRYLGLKYLSAKEQRLLGLTANDTNDITGNGFNGDVVKTEEPKTQKVKTEIDINQANSVARDMQSDAPPCNTCGSIMVRNGSCYRCANCGATSGCS